MSRDIAGTNREFTVEGISFRVAGDANFSEIITQFENSMIPTSGSAMRKMMKRIPARESVVLITNAEERENLISFSEGLDNIKMSYVNAAGDTYKCEGTLEIETNETEENRTTCQVLPVGTWTPFFGS